MEPLFNPKKHQAYERRERNDKIVNGIANRFLVDTTEETRRIKLAQEDSKRDNDRFAAKEEMRLKARKAKE